MLWSSLPDNPCAAVKLHSKNQLTIQTNPEAVGSYLSSLGPVPAPYAHPLSNTFGDLPWHHSGQLLNLYNLNAITITGYLGIYDTPSLIHLLEDRSSSGDAEPRGECMADQKRGRPGTAIRHQFLTSANTRRATTLPSLSPALRACALIACISTICGCLSFEGIDFEGIYKLERMSVI